MNECEIALRVAVRVLAGKRPDDMFKGVFFDIKEKAKAYINKQSDMAIQYVRNAMGQDLQNKGFQIGGLELKLGKFKGHPYITSAKLRIRSADPFEGENDPKLKKLLSYLQTKYSPKYKVKNVLEDGSALFNVR